MVHAAAAAAAATMGHKLIQKRVSLLMMMLFMMVVVLVVMIVVVVHHHVVSSAVVHVLVRCPFAWLLMLKVLLLLLMLKLTTIHTRNGLGRNTVETGLSTTSRQIVDLVVTLVKDAVQERTFVVLRVMLVRVVFESALHSTHTAVAVVAATAAAMVTKERLRQLVW